MLAVEFTPFFLLKKAKRVKGTCPRPSSLKKNPENPFRNPLSPPVTKSICAFPVILSPLCVLRTPIKGLIKLWKNYTVSINFLYYPDSFLRILLAKGGEGIKFACKICRLFIFYNLYLVPTSTRL